MSDYIESIQNLADKFGSLPGVGKKTALRLAYSVLEMTDEDAKAFAEAITDAKEKIHLCPICQSLTDREICSVCDDLTRDKGIICVVEDPRDVNAIEKVREFKGLYHVLHGVISPMNNITPDKIRISELLARLNEENCPVREIIIATNPTVEGEATAMYISRLIKPMGIQVSRLAYGMPVGGNLEYADSVTLFRALEGRRSF